MIAKKAVYQDHFQDISHVTNLIGMHVSTYLISSFINSKLIRKFPRGSLKNHVDTKEWVGGQSDIYGYKVDNDLFICLQGVGG